MMTSYPGPILQFKCLGINHQNVIISDGWLDSKIIDTTNTDTYNIDTWFFKILVWYFTHMGDMVHLVAAGKKKPSDTRKAQKPYQEYNSVF